VTQDTLELHQDKLEDQLEAQEFLQAIRVGYLAVD
jgi:hypothetical protein